MSPSSVMPSVSTGPAHLVEGPHRWRVRVPYRHLLMLPPSWPGFHLEAGSTSAPSVLVDPVRVRRAEGPGPTGSWRSWANVAGDLVVQGTGDLPTWLSSVRAVEAVPFSDVVDRWPPTPDVGHVNAELTEACYRYRFGA